MTAAASKSDFPVPSAASVMAEIKTTAVAPRKYIRLPENLADNDELAKKYHESAYDHFTRFQGQASRSELEEKLKNADAMWRLSKRRNRTDGTEDNQQDTLANTAASQFYNTVRLITAGQRAIIFSDPDELPARHEPEAQSDDYTDEEGKRIAEGDNLLLRHTWDENGWDQLIKRSLQWVNKNSMEMLSLEWDYRTEKCTERVAGYYNEAGEPVALERGKEPNETMFDYEGNEIASMIDPDTGRPRMFVFVERTRVVKNSPTLARHDLKNVYFDLDIPDIQNQQCIVIRSQKTFSELLDGQRTGLYKNVDKLTSDQLFESETKHDSSVDSDRDDNAENDRDNMANGMFDVFHVWMIAPVDWDKKKWDEDAVPRITEAVFAGPFGEYGNAGEGKSEEKATGCVCLQLRKNPYNHGKFPHQLLYSHDDDRGAVRIGYQTLLECNYEMQTSRQNQWSDNIESAVRAPWIAEKGNVLTRPLTFASNRVFWVKPGSGKTALTKLDVPDMTQQFVQELGALRDDADRTAGTTEAFKGEFAGSRTTGTEYLGAKEQALKPALEDAKFIAGQIFPWLLSGVADLWRQFGDPKKIISVTGANNALLGQVRPGEQYGRTKTRIVSIEKFETDLTARQVLVNFIQAGGYDKAAPFMGQEGALYFWRMTAKYLKMPSVNKIFPGSRKYVEAENQAYSDVQKILADPVAAMQDQEALPKEGEMHDVHVGILSQYRDRYELMRNADENWNPAAMDAFNLWITMHEQLKAQEGAEQAQQQQQAAGGAGGAVGAEATQAGMMGAGEQPEMAGEAQGDMMAGTMGQATQGA